MAFSGPEMIREAIDALMRADAARLECLAQQAPGLACPVNERERRAALAEQRTLGRLLSLTRRNLRLLRYGRSETEPCSPGRG
jgi:hypothetical protein